MIVCIAEKPSVAREIAAIIGAHTKKQGYLEGNGYCVTWTYGHLCTLKEPQDYNPSWRSWQIRTLPMIPERFGIKAIEVDNYKKQLSVIGWLIKRAEKVINCGDAGQEGELIQRWVLQKVGCQVPVERLWISSLTAQAIREGFTHLRPAEDFRSLYEAGLARAIGDWLLGLNATRLYSIRYGTPANKLLSVGRVQTPTLALIVTRCQEIAHFVPTTYWELKTAYRHVIFSAEKGRFDEKEKGRKLLTRIADSPFVIKEVKTKEGKELPPHLFDLTGLQVECNKKFGLSADETLRAIQSLYEKKLTTYPRVDTAYLPDDIYPKVPTILRGLVPYREYTAPLFDKKLRKSKKIFDSSKVTDHHAIIPTGEPIHNLPPSEKKVFDLITRRFIAAFYPDCIFSTTTVRGQAAGIPFKTSGKQILSLGWRTLYSKVQSETSKEDEEDKKEEIEEEKTLPSFEINEEGPHLPELQEKQTQPPKLYTEATLLRAMETAGKLTDDETLREALKENGIGRPSTRAGIIETLLKRGYITKQRKSLTATTIGIDLIRSIRSELLKSVELTGQWERKLRLIERREIQAADFLSELKELLFTLVNDVVAPPAAPQRDDQAHTTTPDKNGDYPLTCPDCKSGTVLRGRTAYGCSAYQRGCTFRLPYTDHPATLSNLELAQLLSSLR